MPDAETKTLRSIKVVGLYSDGSGSATVTQTDDGRITIEGDTDGSLWEILPSAARAVGLAISELTEDLV